MASSFPLLQLPLLPLLDILKDMDPNQLIFLSMLSKRAKRLVEELRYKITAGSWLFDENHFNASIELSSGKRSFLSVPWTCYRKKEFHPEEFQLNGRLLTLCRQMHEGVPEWHIGTPSQSLQEQLSSMDVLTEHIFNMFRLSPTPPKFSFACFPYSNFELSELFLWKYTKTFDDFSWGSAPPFDEFGRRLFRYFLSREQLKFAFENLTVGHFSLFPTESMDFRYNGPLRMDTLEISDMDGDEDENWLTRQCLSTMECRIVRISCYVPEDSLYFLIDHWQRGGLPNLEYFEAKLDWDSDVLDDFTRMPWDPKNRPKFWKDKDLSKCWDIRGDDGRIATIDTVDPFKFYVWK